MFTTMFKTKTVIEFNINEENIREYILMDPAGQAAIRKQLDKKQIQQLEIAVKKFAKAVTETVLIMQAEKNQLSLSNQKMKARLESTTRMLVNTQQSLNQKTSEVNRLTGVIQDNIEVPMVSMKALMAKHGVPFECQNNRKLVHSIARRLAKEANKDFVNFKQITSTVAPQRSTYPRHILIAAIIEAGSDIEF